MQTPIPLHYIHLYTRYMQLFLVFLLLFVCFF